MLGHYQSLPCRVEFCTKKTSTNNQLNIILIMSSGPVQSILQSVNQFLIKSLDHLKLLVEHRSMLSSPLQKKKEKINQNLHIRNMPAC